MCWHQTPCRHASLPIGPRRRSANPNAPSATHGHRCAAHRERVAFVAVTLPASLPTSPASVLRPPRIVAVYVCSGSRHGCVGADQVCPVRFVFVVVGGSGLVSWRVRCGWAEPVQVQPVPCHGLCFSCLRCCVCVRGLCSVLRFSASVWGHPWWYVNAAVGYGQQPVVGAECRWQAVRSGPSCRHVSSLGRVV